MTRRATIDKEFIERLQTKIIGDEPAIFTYLETDDEDLIEHPITGYYGYVHNDDYSKVYSRPTNAAQLIVGITSGFLTFVALTASAYKTQSSLSLSALLKHITTGFGAGTIGYGAVEIFSKESLPNTDELVEAFPCKEIVQVLRNQTSSYSHTEELDGLVHKVSHIEIIGDYPECIDAQ